ncbi:hypothetical protein BN946_scf184911.g34 [Trametes cinnabarina]|uniref:Uncharacterized protein n=1 Tax=Pycnoporus cinnabarinus TaxID=5643 RepID=A0A060SH40_PYCCI|nr:hypothetical protein BN946_scf184911.g34 [Trametes cinnabarina]
MADFIQALDPSKLVIAGTALSFITSGFSAPSYNLPIFLFGIYVQEASEAVQSMRAFTFLLGGSMFYDIIWMFSNTQHWFIKFLSILLLLLKIPTTFAFVTAFQQRGGQFSGLGFRGNDLSGATVWSMPGGFTSGGRDGYQNVDSPVDAPKPLSVPPAPPAPPAAAAPSNPGAYQSV